MLVETLEDDVLKEELFVKIVLLFENIKEERNLLSIVFEVVSFLVVMPIKNLVSFGLTFIA